jgi:uncharacterized protein YndB with AHSA1/START domain
VIDAPLERVRALHTDIDAWADWNTDVDQARLDGPLLPANSFHWKTHGMDITSTIREVVRGRRLVWGGPAQGITAIHVWTFTPTTDGVIVHTEESWTGDPVTADQATLQTALDNSLHNWVNNLKHQAESQVGK